MREFYRENKPRIDRVLFLVLVTVVFYLMFTVLFVYVSPFFVGLVIALVMEPLNRFLERKLNFKRWIAALVSLLVFLALVGSLGAWLVTTLVRQIVNFAESWPVHVAEISERLNEANIWLQRFTAQMPEGWYIPNIEEMVPAALGIFFAGGMEWRTLGVVPDFFINLIIGLVSAYFFMSDGKRIYAFVKEMTPRWVRRQMRLTKKGLTRATSGYFRAQGILMVMVGAISIIGLLFLRNPYALLLGILLAVLDFLPVFGPALVLLPWAAISAVMGNMSQAIGLLIIWGIITIARQVLQPKILGTQMGAHPLASLMSIYIGFRMFGLLGLIVGPTLLMIIIAIRDTNMEEQESRGATAAGR